MQKEIRNFYKQIYSEDSSFQKKFGKDSHVLSGVRDMTNRFEKLLTEFLVGEGLVRAERSSLEDLHINLEKKYLVCETSWEYNNSRPIVEDMVLDFIEKNEELYLSFMKELYSVIGEDFYFQKIPTVRFHFPDYNENLQLPAWHVDSMLGHSPKEINVWFTLTNNKVTDFWLSDFDRTRKWFEEYNFDLASWKKDCFNRDDMIIERGYLVVDEVYSGLDNNTNDNILLFDSRCVHGASYRERDKTTKVSIDTRIILVKDYEWVVFDDNPLYVGTGFRKAEFRPGHPYGYNKKSINEVVSEAL